MKAYIVKGFNKEEYPEDYMEYIATVVLDEAEANALTERLERESRITGYTQ